MKESYLQSGRSNQKLETRKKIIAGAQHLLSTSGRLTLEDVAKHVGISRATIYRYYSNIDLLISEAGIAAPEDSQSILLGLESLDLNAQLQGIQQYYNEHTLSNEMAFRKFLSINISADQIGNKRGARRIATLKMALEKTNLNVKEKTKLANLLTLLMGIEPIIVTKDVCGLSNKASIDLLRWGFDLILKGITIESKGR